MIAACGYHDSLFGRMAHEAERVAATDDVSNGVTVASHFSKTEGAGVGAEGRGGRKGGGSQ